MSATTNTDPAPTPWWEAEPARLRRDCEEVTARYPNLEYRTEDPTGWTGYLPRWPFERPEPPELVDLIGDHGLQVLVFYPPAYPMVAARIFPVDPEPEIVARTQQRWHVLGDGALCLLQSSAAWNPSTSITDLLDKAAGWRIEYALMLAGLVDVMSINGIVNDASFDHLIGQAAAAVQGAPNMDEESAA